MKFEEFKLDEKVLKAVQRMHYEDASDIQEKAIPLLMLKKDMIGSAQTGTGKTCAFMLPIIDRIIKSELENGKIKALIITPTRELAQQIADNTKLYCKYSNIKSLAVYGGVREGLQKKDLRAGVDILIATPGRLMDFMEQKVVDLSNVNYLVLDEADMMLDMGFIKDVYKITATLPSERQTLLFSATMPDTIKELSKKLLNNPEKIEIVPELTPVEKITQNIYFVEKKDKSKLLIDILKNGNVFRVLVFVRTKRSADKLTKELKENKLLASAIHGEKSQNSRVQALNDFKKCRIQALIATDIAARGIDIDDLDMVINYDLPDVAETYVHRIGRTARAGKSGQAIIFCSPDEFYMAKSIEKLCKIKLNILFNEQYSIQKILLNDQSNDVSSAFDKTSTSKRSGSSYARNRTSNMNSAQKGYATRKRHEKGDANKSSNNEKKGPSNNKNSSSSYKGNYKKSSYGKSFSKTDKKNERSGDSYSTTSKKRSNKDDYSSRNKISSKSQKNKYKNYSF